MSCFSCPGRIGPGVDEPDARVFEMAGVAGDQGQPMPQRSGSDDDVQRILHATHGAQRSLELAELLPHDLVGIEDAAIELLRQGVRPGLQLVALGAGGRQAMP